MYINIKIIDASHMKNLKQITFEYEFSTKSKVCVSGPWSAYEDSGNHLHHTESFGQLCDIKKKKAIMYYILWLYLKLRKGDVTILYWFMFRPRTNIA